MEMSAGQGQAPLEGDLLEDKRTNWLIAFSAFPSMTWGTDIMYISLVTLESRHFFIVEDHLEQKNNKAYYMEFLKNQSFPHYWMNVFIIDTVTWLIWKAEVRKEGWAEGEIGPWCGHNKGLSQTHGSSELGWRRGTRPLCANRDQPLDADVPKSVCACVCDPGWGQFLESVSEARGRSASVLEQGPECCITVSTTVDILENRSEKKKTKMTPDPTNLRKGLTFWYISSPSFIAYRYMYVYEMCIGCVCMHNHTCTHIYTAEMNRTISHLAFFWIYHKYSLCVNTD